jgi:hypothetical protein
MLLLFYFFVAMVTDVTPIFLQKVVRSFKHSNFLNKEET